MTRCQKHFGNYHLLTVLCDVYCVTVCAKTLCELKINTVKRLNICENTGLCIQMHVKSIVRGEEVQPMTLLVLLQQLAFIQCTNVGVEKLNC